MMLHAPVDGGGDVFLLAFAFVVRAGARPRAAEVEAQRGHVRALQPARHAKDDFVVQRAAAERMRMADHRDARRILQLAVERLEPAGAAEEIDVAQRLRIHSILTSTRSSSTRTS